MRRAKFVGLAELREGRCEVEVDTLIISSSLGFSWSLLGSSAAFLNSADWVTIVAVEGRDRSSGEVMC